MLGQFFISSYLPASSLHLGDLGRSPSNGSGLKLASVHKNWTVIVAWVVLVGSCDVRGHRGCETTVEYKTKRDVGWARAKDKGQDGGGYFLKEPINCNVIIVKLSPHDWSWSPSEAVKVARNESYRCNQRSMTSVKLHTSIFRSKILYP